MKRVLIFLVILITLSACSGGGAVVFAPTPVAPEDTPVTYVHPSGAFSARLPYTWSVYEQHTTTLASASFSPAGAHEPVLTIGVINLGEPLDSQAFGDAINRYQTQIRGDLGSYTEQSRQAMGDGSWRLAGIRTLAGGATQPLNTFLYHTGTLLGVIEIEVPSTPLERERYQRIVNSVSFTEVESLEPAELTTLTFLKNSSLGILHVAAWTAADGVFFITGEVANYGLETVADLPIEAALLDAGGRTLIGAVDTVMGAGIPPGGFAPFSLRFGGGQPGNTASYVLTLGKDWQAQPVSIVGSEVLSWTDSFAYDSNGRLVISGEVTHTGGAPARDLRAIATVFDPAQNVIGAAFAEVTPGALQAGETGTFSITLPEIGGEPVNYIVSVQGIP